MHVRYVKSLFTNIRKQYNILKISLLFKKFINFTGKITREFLGLRNEIFRVLFLYEHKDIGIFSNLLYCTFKNTVKNQNNEKYCYKID